MWTITLWRRTPNTRHIIFPLIYHTITVASTTMKSYLTIAALLGFAPNPALQTTGHRRTLNFPIVENHVPAAVLNQDVEDGTDDQHVENHPDDQNIPDGNNNILYNDPEQITRIARLLSQMTEEQFIQYERELMEQMRQILARRIPDSVGQLLDRLQAIPPFERWIIWDSMTRETLSEEQIQDQILRLDYFYDQTVSRIQHEDAALAQLDLALQHGDPQEIRHVIRTARDRIFTTPGTTVYPGFRSLLYLLGRFIHSLASHGQLAVMEGLTQSDLHEIFTAVVPRRVEVYMQSIMAMEPHERMFVWTLVESRTLNERDIESLMISFQNELARRRMNARVQSDRREMLHQGEGNVMEANQANADSGRITENPRQLLREGMQGDFPTDYAQPIAEAQESQVDTESRSPFDAIGVSDNNLPTRARRTSPDRRRSRSRSRSPIHRPGRRYRSPSHS